MSQDSARPHDVMMIDCHPWNPWHGYFHWKRQEIHHSWIPGGQRWWIYMDMIPGMIPETFKELSMSTKHFNWFHYWFLNATYTCIMHRSIESIRTDSCPNKMHLYFPRPNANMTKRPLPRINHDTATPSYNLNNMKHHKLHKPWQTMTNHEYPW